MNAKRPWSFFYKSLSNRPAIVVIELLIPLDGWWLGLLMAPVSFIDHFDLSWLHIPSSVVGYSLSESILVRDVLSLDTLLPKVFGLLQLLLSHLLHFVRLDKVVGFHLFLNLLDQHSVDLFDLLLVIIINRFGLLDTLLDVFSGVGYVGLRPL